MTKIKEVKKEIDRKRHLLERLMGSIPKRRKVQAGIIERKEFPHYFREKIFYLNEEKEKIPAYLLLPKSFSKKKFSGIIIPHQHGGSWRDGKSETVGLSGNKKWAMGLNLVRKGFVILAPDSKCFEERVISGMKPDVWNERFEAMRLLLLGKTLAGRMVTDLIYGLDYLISRPEVDSSCIGCIGFSMGGGQVVFWSALDMRLQAAVSIGGFANYESYFKNRTVHCFLLSRHYSILLFFDC